MTPASRTRVLLVGLGGVGLRRLALLGSHPRARVVGAVDTSEGARAEARARGLENAAADLPGALARLRPDAVVVSTPHGLHEAQVAAALDAGAHVLCEKPLGAGAPGVRRLIARAEAAGLHLAMARNHLHLPSVAGALELVARGRIGALGDLEIEVGHGRGASLPAWHRTPALAGGGCLRDNGAHALLLTHALWTSCGDLPVSARVRRAVEMSDSGGGAGTGGAGTGGAEMDGAEMDGAEMDGAGTGGAGRPRAGATGSGGVEAWIDGEIEAEVTSAAGRRLALKASWRLEGGYRFAVRIRGERGDVEIEGPTGLRLRAEGGWRPIDVHDAGPMESWRRDTEDFLELIRSGGGAAQRSGAAALWTAELTDALYRSAASGRTEPLPPGVATRSGAPRTAPRPPPA